MQTLKPMSFSSTTARSQYTANGSQVDFVIQFPFQADADIGVIVTTSGVDVTMTLNTDYTVSGEGTTGGGNVRFTSAPASGTTVTIFRNLDLNQTRAFTYNGSFPTRTVTDAADKAMQAAQQLDEKLKRTFRISEASAEIAPLTVAERAGKVPAFDANGHPTLIAPEITAFQYGAPYAVSNVTALKALPAIIIPTGTQVSVAGYYTPSDGGGGLFYFSSGSSASDDGGTVIQPTSGSGRWLRSFSGIVNVRWFGAKGDASNDDTTNMQAAHDLGVPVFYPIGRYKFSTITLSTGGIIGEGKATILDSTDTGTSDLITYTGGDSTGLLVNELGAVFRDFYLRCDTVGQKSSGAGIKINPGTTNENYTSLVANVTVRNVPTCVYSTNSSFITIRDCYFSFFSVAGVYEDNNVAAFEDNGDNGIVNNWFYTNQANAVCVKYRGGGGRILNNKINLGLVGIDISPLRSTSVMIVNGNSIEGQTSACIRFQTEGDSSATAFSQVIITGNQINAYQATWAIQINPTAFDLEELSITGNTIRFYTDVSNAVDIRKCSRFLVADNTVECNNLGYRGFFLANTAVNGQMTENRVFRFTNVHTLSNSTSTTTTQTVGVASATYDPPNIADGASASTTVSVTGAVVGDLAFATFSLDLSGMNVFAYVSSADTVTVVFENETGAPIDMASGTLRVRVVKA